MESMDVAQFEDTGKVYLLNWKILAWRRGIATMSMHVGVAMYTCVCVCVYVWDWGGGGGGGRLAYMCMETYAYTYMCTHLQM